MMQKHRPMPATLLVCAGAEMVWATYGALLSPEGWLDQEAHESDLRGSRGVALAGALMIFMGVANFRHTARPLNSGPYGESVF